VQQGRTSVVICARSGPAPVLSALESLHRLPSSNSLEIVVANCCGQETAAQIAGCFPRTTVLALSPDTSIADARHAATRETTGDLVAVLQERYRAPADWLDRLRQVHAAEPADVVSGVIGPASAMTPAAWAIFLTEYAHVAPPLPSGALDRASACMIPGGNVSYKRAAFQKASMAGRLWELDFHAALYDSGARFHRDGAIVVEFGSPQSVREYAAERFQLSRQFAARRATGKSSLVRFALAAASLALPALVVGRVAGAVLRKRVYLWRFLLALPWITAFSMVQACGEAAGCLTTAGAQPQSVSHASAPGPKR
jgi:hypothetical protein